MAEDICKKGKDENIASITEGKDTLKKLMSGNLDDIEGMEEAQAKMKGGFDILNGKAQTPTEYCYCYDWDEEYVETDDNLDPIAPTDKASCEDAFGVWVCKKVESINLQDKLSELVGVTDEKVFGEKLSAINKSFSNTVSGFSDKLKSLNPALADFMAKGELPEIPSEVSTCVGYNENLVDTDDNFDPIAPTTQEECLLAGGTWKTEPARDFPDVLSDINKKIGQATSKVTDFFSGQINSANTSILQSNGAINFGSGNKFQMPNLADKIPKPGQIVEVCQCKRYDESLLDTDENFDPIVPTDKASCLAAGGEWICKEQPAPDLGSLLSPNGLPSFSLEDICNKVENIKVETQVKKDPVTNRESIEPVAQTKPKKAIVPKEPPKTPQPSPPADIDRRLGELQAINSFNRAVTGSLQAFMYLFTNEKWNMPKKDAKRVIQVLQYYGWRDFAESVNADFNFVLKTMAIPSVKNLTAEKIYAVWVMFYRDYVKKPLTTAGIEKSEKRMWNMWKKVYAKKTTSSYEFDTAVLIAWNDALSKASKANTVVPEYSEPERVKQDIALAEEEIPPPAEPAVTGGPKTITWKGAKITFTEPEVRQDPNNGTLKYYWDTSDKSAFAYISEIRSQEDLDGILKIARAQSGTYELYKTDRTKREYKIVYYGEHVKNYKKWSRAFIKTADGTYK